MTVSEVFAKQLMQLSGVSPDKAVAILEKYPTPKRYRAEFHNLKHFFVVIYSDAFCSSTFNQIFHQEPIAFSHNPNLMKLKAGACMMQPGFYWRC